MAASQQQAGVPAGAHLALRRAARDLAALVAEPLPGIAARPAGEDLLTWHFNVRGARGELRGLAVHGVLRLSHRYPAEPPQLRLCTPVPHPNVSESSEGYEVCMDLLEAGGAAPYSGWSSSYCAGSLLLQVQSTLFDEGAGVYHEVTLDEALRLSSLCTCTCGHAGGRPQPAFPTVEDFRAARRSRPVSRPSLSQLAGLPRALGVPVPRSAAPAASSAGAAKLEGKAKEEAGCAETTGEAKPEGGDDEGWREVARRQRRKEGPGARQGLAVPPPPVPSSQGCREGGACQCSSGWGIRRVGGRWADGASPAQQRNARRAQRRMQSRLQQAAGSGDDVLERQASVQESVGGQPGASSGGGPAEQALSRRKLEEECRLASEAPSRATSSRDLPPAADDPLLAVDPDEVYESSVEDLARRVDHALVAKFRFPQRKDRLDKVAAAFADAGLDGALLLKLGGREAIARLLYERCNASLRPRVFDCAVSVLESLALAVSSAPRAPPSASEPAEGEPARVSAELRSVGVDIRLVPRQLLVECLLFASAEDSARLALCGRFFASLGEDGLLWRNFFSQCYPSSQLTAASMADWKHCFLLEVNGTEADLVCYFTKASVREAVLGIPLDFSVNPRTRRVDYISTTLDLLSVDAFDAGVRMSQWNEPFKVLLPIFISPDHFQQARPRMERTILSLSPHWRTSRFHPLMVLEVLPKLMNTMVVLLCDKGLAVSDRALDGYFVLWRLLGACVQTYGLEGEVRDRLLAFRDPRKRTKAEVPSLGDFLPMISVSGQPASCWAALVQPILEECFDRNVLWACRDNPGFAAAENNQLRQGADAKRLAATFASTKVSKRLLMFHASFLQLVDQQRLDLFFGRPPQHLRQNFKASVRKVLDVDNWPGFFAACGRQCPGPAAVTDLLKQATNNSLRKGYHTARTDFSRIHANGVSHVLKKGESYKVDHGVRQVRLELGSDSRTILCGACLVYEDLNCRQVVSYDQSLGYNGAVKHSGDMIVDGKSKHVIEIDLKALPSAVTRLFLTLCSCGCADLSGFRTPSIKMLGSDGQPLCQYDLEQAGRSPTVVMAAILREGGQWRVTAVGRHSPVRCCGNYSRVKQDIASLRL